ncbi:hypothetical protein HMN09_01237600 [Mycena chlorophos]|uniref:Rho-GAP domain-containing protein n=1 Tax=Mycena chlorophos TaxID=658473 RepID=A0A8H6VS43_MYCCL|nr:hypothetical protein HMN09_01237600 [Mycena chlorophos]
MTAELRWRLFYSMRKPRLRDPKLEAVRRGTPNNKPTCSSSTSTANARRRASTSYNNQVSLVSSPNAALAHVLAVASTANLFPSTYDTLVNNTKRTGSYQPAQPVLRIPRWIAKWRFQRLAGCSARSRPAATPATGTPRRRQHSPEQHRREGAPKGFQPTLDTVVSSPITPLPPQSDRPHSPDSGAPSVPVANFPHRAVFGVSLEESLDVAQIENLPAIVYRCIQYLQTKKADQEEGIYRLSGSSAVIKALKDRFNIEGDIDLVGSDEYWDPHAIAGLLKSFLRELPASILTHNLHMRFLSVVDYTDPQERINELAQLIGALPFPNYSLLRALTAHLILIVQNATINKMTMRNVGIVFSPTLGIPAPLFNLMLSEFSRVFSKVDGDGAPSESSESLPLKHQLPTSARLHTRTCRRTTSRLSMRVERKRRKTMQQRSLRARVQRQPNHLRVD